MYQFFFSLINDVYFFKQSARILMVMELMEGGELFELIRAKRWFTEKEAVNFSKQVRPLDNLFLASTVSFHKCTPAD